LFFFYFRRFFGLIWQMWLFVVQSSRTGCKPVFLKKFGKVMKTKLKLIFFLGLTLTGGCLMGAEEGRDLEQGAPTSPASPAGSRPALSSSSVSSPPSTRRGWSAEAEGIHTSTVAALSIAQNESEEPQFFFARIFARHLYTKVIEVTENENCIAEGPLARQLYDRLNLESYTGAQMLLPKILKMVGRHINNPSRETNPSPFLQLLGEPRDGRNGNEPSFICAFSSMMTESDCIQYRQSVLPTLPAERRHIAEARLREIEIRLGITDSFPPPFPPLPPPSYPRSYAFRRSCP
jgi:hypothetical protein